MNGYQPLAGIKVLDLGILIPAALTSGKLAALGADVVKVEQPPAGDRIRKIPPFAPDGGSPQHMSQNWGKRSIALDVRDKADRETLIALVRAADVVVENQLAGFWLEAGVDFAELRKERPELVICSITGFGQTGPWAGLPAHGLNVDALADGINLVWEDGRPHRGWAFTSWGNELGALSAVAGTCAAIASVRAGGEGAWVDVSCWDALVETHRTEIAMTHRTGKAFSYRDTPRQALYTTYLSSDGVPILIGALEHKFWKRFCAGIGREDLVSHHEGGELEYGDADAALEAELETVFAKEDAATWMERFRTWDVPGGPVLDVQGFMASDHFAAREIMSGSEGEWPTVATAIRWHHTGTRAGDSLTPPPDFNVHADGIRRDWLG
ncbi:MULTISPECIES: CaiB/BaiF CoA transferase family protein [unclassified Rhodococcus (in: high G+C Gram-positive bacteria)]|jgi:alpha-methylacyl-CoA racemase|uniref:CaiB/BaiF CoA transferase family protein n=1 Tax=unclassified Rhodococcus (in: high G+C Gram-positive bacteria) TaxID=192944 RepID=UPI0013202631|nr:MULTISPECIES: CoA transferase [Rhodococcus]QHE70323.1 Alpha-methylacyl-CoA racemase [Rhodococcus sp. WAY2]GLK34147.1 CoA transferase [Rhodococcus wratislaviensis]